MTKTQNPQEMREGRSGLLNHLPKESKDETLQSVRQIDKAVCRNLLLQVYSVPIHWKEQRTVRFEVRPLTTNQGAKR